MKIENGVIVEIVLYIDVKNEEVIDVGGNFLLLGLIDVYVYLCELGGEKKEMIEMGILVVVKGGFIVIVVMLNMCLVLDIVE